MLIAAMKGDKDETIYEIADLCYHTLVLMVACGISIADITKELAARKIINKKIKQGKLK